MNRVDGQGELALLTRADPNDVPMEMIRRIEFQEQRSWGAVFTQAAREGYLRRSDVLFSSSFGNGSLAPGWVGV